MLRRMVMTRTDCANMREAQDIAERIGLNVPRYDSAPVSHVADRIRELKARADEGDRFALAILNGNYAGEDPVD